MRTPARDPELPASTVHYGDDPSEVADLYLPPGHGSALPVVVVVHGGFWSAAYGRDLGAPLALDLIQHGVAVWNIEYRRLGNGGGFPTTLVDVASAVDALATQGNIAAGGRLDLNRVVAVGHSAGGQLAMWLAGRSKLPSHAPGAGPKVRLRGVVSQAGVLDLVSAADQYLGSGAAVAFLGGRPTEVPARYAIASPYALLPLAVPATLVHGVADTVVPIDQSDRYAGAARAAGDVVVEHRLAGVDHFALIDPATPAWAQCRTAALGYLGL